MIRCCYPRTASVYLSSCLWPDVFLPLSLSNLDLSCQTLRASEPKYGWTLLKTASDDNARRRNARLPYDWRRSEAEKDGELLLEASGGDEKRGVIFKNKHNPLRARTFPDLTSFCILRLATKSKADKEGTAFHTMLGFWRRTSRMMERRVFSMPDETLWLSTLSPCFNTSTANLG